MFDRIKRLLGMGGDRLSRPADDDFWWGGAHVRTHSGVPVNSKTAFNYSAVWAATRLITETIATLPRHLFRETADGKRPATFHSAYRAFHREPNPEMSALNYISQQLNHVINWGNAYAELVRDDKGRVLEEYPIHPRRVTVRRNDRDEVEYAVNDEDGKPPKVFPLVDGRGFRPMLHIPGLLSEDGVTGKGVLQVAAESIGMGLATERFGAAWFGNGANPSVVLRSPKVLSEQAQENLRSSWRKRFQGPDKSGAVAILEEGMDVTRLDVPPEASQFLGTRQFNITEIARWYNLPVHLLREMSKSSFNNIEQENLHFVMISLMPWAKRIEEERDRQILTENEQDRYFHKFMFNGLLRGDVAARTSHYISMFNIGGYSLNDIMELEDRNKLPPEIGDVRLVMGNNYVPLAAVIAGATLPPVVAAAVQPAEEPPQPEQEQQQSVDGLVAALREELAAQHAAELDRLLEDERERHGGRVGELRTEVQAMLDAQAQRERQMLAAARRMLVASLSRVVGREAAKLREFARNPAKFLENVEQYYSRRASVLTEALQPACAACEALGVTVSADTIAETEVTVAREELLELAGRVTATELPEAVEVYVSGWESDKAERIASEVLSPLEV